MKNKGFTLIELLGVIVILSILALVAGISVDSVIKRNKAKLQNTVITKIDDSINSYLANYSLELAKYDNIEIYTNLMGLSSEGYIEYKIQDPVSNKYIDPYKLIKITKTNGDISFDISILLTDLIDKLDSIKVCSINTNSINSSGKYDNIKVNCEGTDYDSTTTLDSLTNNSLQKVYVSTLDKYLYVNNIGQNSYSLATLLKKNCSKDNSVGLIEDNDGTCYYKGTNTEVGNNWVWWAGILWRVMSINSDNTLTMISSGPLTAIQPSSSVWDTKEKYDNSYINTWLNSTGKDGVLYKNLTKSDRNKIVDSLFNIGIFNNVTEITSRQHFGLLDTAQYMKGGSTNSYLDIKDCFWLGNRYDSSYNIGVFSTGSFGGSNVTRSDGVRAVVKISDITISSNDSTLGTITNPYKETSIGTNTNNIKAGEYVSIPYSSGTKYCNSTTRCLFRVVSIDSNSIKVTLNGLLNTTSAFGSTSIYTIGNTIDTLIGTFINTIPGTYRYTKMDKTFSIGKYDYIGENYNVVNENTINNLYGLPVVGNLFTGNDIDITTTTKTFVDSNIIENSALTNYYLTMNARDSVFVRNATDSGSLGDYNPSGVYGVRPVLFLKKGTSRDLTFTSGDGTANNPYILGN